MFYPLIIIATMINLFQYLCDDPDMDLSPIREKSGKLYHDILRERQYYAEHPECQNIHFFHMAFQNSIVSFWVDRWGIVVLSNIRGSMRSLRPGIPHSPAMRIKSLNGYFFICIHRNGKYSSESIHHLIADVFLPNTDFTKCQMDHLNSEHLDNNALNLERVTPEENIRRREVTNCQKKGQPIPWKYQTPENYLNYLQTKNSKS